MSCHHTCKFNIDIFDRFLCSQNGQHIVPLLSILTFIDPSFCPSVTVCPCTDPENSIMGVGGESCQCFFLVINIHVFHRGWYRPPSRPNGSNCFSRGVGYQNFRGNLQPRYDFPTWGLVPIVESFRINPEFQDFEAEFP